MSDDEVVPMTMLDEPAVAVEVADEPGAHWTKVVLALSAAVAAAAFAVIASAELAETRSVEQQTCLQRAQILAFGPVARDVDQEERFRDALAECDVEVPGRD